MSWIQRRKPLSRNKYGSSKASDTAGRSFDSKLERSVFSLLELQLRNGEITQIKQQATVYLTRARILYKPDFEVRDAAGETYWVEAKGFPTAVWAIKKRLWKHYGPGRLLIFTGSASNPVLSETLVPEVQHEP